MHLGSVVIISRMMYMHFLLINSILISCFICYLMTTLIFFPLQNQVENGFIQFCIYGFTWLLMYKLETIILWITIAFFPQTFFFCFTGSPLYSLCWRLKPRSRALIARRTLYHTLVCKVKTKQRQVLPSVLEFETKILCRIARHTLYLKGLHSQL